MGLVTAALNLALDALDESGNVLKYASLHTADPGTNGANEVTGGSYTREAVTWGAASSGSKAATGLPTFDVPASTTITHIGFWSASTEGTFYGSMALSAQEVFAGAGTYTPTSLTVSAS